MIRYPFHVERNPNPPEYYDPIPDLTRFRCPCGAVYAQEDAVIHSYSTGEPDSAHCPRCGRDRADATWLDQCDGEGEA